MWRGHCAHWAERGLRSIFRIADYTGVDRSGHDPTPFVVRNQSRKIVRLAVVLLR